MKTMKGMNEKNMKAKGPSMFGVVNGDSGIETVLFHVCSVANLETPGGPSCCN